MRHWAVWTRQTISESDLKIFVEDHGGEWQDEPSLRQGVIGKGQASIFLSVVDPRAEEFVDQLSRIKTLLGATPLGGVDIHISHVEGSTDLAEIMARAVCRKWNGLVDSHLSG